MILDLSTSDDGVSLEAPVIIVGGGIAGLVLAHRLRGAGVRVIVVESGGLKPSPVDDELNAIEQLGDYYQMPTVGRSRGLGGTSSKWGGALLTYRPEDLAPRPHIGLAGWPIEQRELDPYVDEIERLFQVAPSSYEDDPLGRSGGIPVGDAVFSARFAKWPAFKLRNLATLLGAAFDGDRDLTLLLNATVTGFAVDREAGRLTAITAESPTGRRATVRGGRFVLAAGAIESTRLLLLLDRQTEGAPFAKAFAPGTGFFDHIGTACASIEARDPAALNRLAGFRFEKGTMRSMRFELQPAAQAAEGIGSAYAHVHVAADAYSGYDALRDMLRAVQARAGFERKAMMAVVRDAPYLARLAWWRYARGLLCWPTSARYALEVTAEQLPHPDNRIGLGTRTDRFGVPRAAIDWRIRERDLVPFRAFRRLFEAYWSRHGLERIGSLRWAEFLGDAEAFRKRLGDVLHPGGTTRMGRDKATAVVDRELGVFAVPNLSICSTSTFPSGASANPTLTLMALALRLGDRLAVEK